MSKGSVRRPEDQELVKANWEAIFGTRKAPTDVALAMGGAEIVVPLGEWKPGTEVVNAANASDPL